MFKMNALYQIWHDSNGHSNPSPHIMRYQYLISLWFESTDASTTIMFVWIQVSRLTRPLLNI